MCKTFIVRSFQDGVEVLDGTNPDIHYTATLEDAQEWYRYGEDPSEYIESKLGIYATFAQIFAVEEEYERLLSQDPLIN